MLLELFFEEFIAAYISGEIHMTPLNLRRRSEEQSDEHLELFVMSFSPTSL